MTITRARRTGSVPINDVDGRDLIIEVADVKTQCRVTHNSEDDLFVSLIRAATVFCEGQVGRIFVTRAFRDVWDGFPSGCKPEDSYIPLRWAPVPSRPSVFQYVDADGVTQTLSESDYQIDNYRVTPVLAPAYGTSWPATRGETLAAVQIFYEAGGSVAEVDARYKHAVRLIAAHWYRNREAAAERSIKQIEFSVSALLGHKRRQAV